MAFFEGGVGVGVGSGVGSGVGFAVGLGVGSGVGFGVLRSLAGVGLGGGVTVCSGFGITMASAIGMAFGGVRFGSLLGATEGAGTGVVAGRTRSGVGAGSVRIRSRVRKKSCRLRNSSAEICPSTVEGRSPANKAESNRRGTRRFNTAGNVSMKPAGSSRAFTRLISPIPDPFSSQEPDRGGSSHAPAAPERDRSISGFCDDDIR